MFYAGGLEPQLQQRAGDPVQFAAMQRQPPSLALSFSPSLPPMQSVAQRQSSHSLHLSSLPSPLKRSSPDFLPSVSVCSLLR